jgi:hypothetical protein
MIATTKAPVKPTPTYLSRPHPAAQRALELALSIPTNILGTANKYFKTLTAHQHPTSWATHTLALNASTSLARHISKAISIILESQPNQTTHPLNILEFPFCPTVDNPIFHRH